VINRKNRIEEVIKHSSAVRTLSSGRYARNFIRHRAPKHQNQPLSTTTTTTTTPRSVFFARILRYFRVRDVWDLLPTIDRDRLIIPFDRIRRSPYSGQYISDVRTSARPFNGKISYTAVFIGNRFRIVEWV